MWMALGIFSFLAFIVTAIASLFFAIKKDIRWKKCLAGTGIAFVLFFVGVSADSTPKPQGQGQGQGQSVQPTATQKKGPTPLETSQEAYKNGVEQYNNKSYDSALAAFSKVISEDTNYQDAQAKIEELKGILVEEHIRKANTNLESNTFDIAQTEINKALAIDPKNEDVLSLKATINNKHVAYLEKKKQQEIIDYKNACQTMSYKVLNKNPDNLAGQKIKLRGEIMQIQEDSGKTFMLLSVTDMGYGIWNDNVAVSYNGTLDIYEDDIITIWGEIAGGFTYKSQAGWNITVPKVTAKYIAKG